MLVELKMVDGAAGFGLEMILFGGLIGSIIAMIIRHVAPPLGLRRGWKWNVVLIDDAGREMREAVHPVRMVARVIMMILRSVG